MENVIKEVIEVPDTIPAPVPEQETGGFPWCGAGIVVALVAVAVIGKKFYCKK